MKLADLRPGWRTDFILHREGSEIVERDAQLAHWLARFDEEIGAWQPRSAHVAIGVHHAYRGEQRPAWGAAGFETQVTAVLRLLPGGLLRPPPARGEVLVRPIDFATEVDAVVELVRVDAHGFEPIGYREYRQRKFEQYRRMHAQGLVDWFGAWCDGQLAATCGLIRERPEAGGIARFQHVVTHPAWRRRGLCSVLVRGASVHGFARWRSSELFMLANPDDVAIGIYRRLGYREIDSEWARERKAAHDRQPLLPEAGA